MRACLLLLLPLIGSSALGYEQPLAFTVTGPTVNRGAHELVGMITPRFGRPEEFLRIESLLGFGYGLTRTLEAQLLIAIAIESFGRDGRAAEGGAQVRVRWHPLDARTDLLGVNVLGAARAGTQSVYFEGRLGAEKWLGEFLFAVNLAFDYQVRRDAAAVPELHAEQSGGIVYRLANNFTTGFEVRNRIGFERGSYYGAAISAGPVFGWRSRAAWISLAALPQVAAVKAESQVGNGEALELRDNERVVLRLQLGLDL